MLDRRKEGSRPTAKIQHRNASWIHRTLLHFGTTLCGDATLVPCPAVCCFAASMRTKHSSPRLFQACRSAESANSQGCPVTATTALGREGKTII
mmetsp:Transcript_18922/g.40687  ORF Transcript_18922/g.40687 Transcript_18922/m.40687 type:complete len:94 (-) Transcript_18922:1028-1309(-)